MKYSMPVLVLALVARLAAAIAVAERVPNVVRVAVPAAQYTARGGELGYTHGAWCIDDRSF